MLGNGPSQPTVLPVQQLLRGLQPVGSPPAARHAPQLFPELALTSASAAPALETPSPPQIVEASDSQGSALAEPSLAAAVASPLELQSAADSKGDLELPASGASQGALRLLEGMQLIKEQKREEKREADKAARDKKREAAEQAKQAVAAARKVEADRLSAAKQEVERLEAERLEAERLEAERLADTQSNKLGAGAKSKQPSKTAAAAPKHAAPGVSLIFC